MIPTYKSRGIVLFARIPTWLKEVLRYISLLVWRLRYFMSPTTQSGKPGKPEYLLCSVWEGNCSPLLVVVVYWPPDVPLQSDRRFLQLLRTCSLDYSPKIIMDNCNEVVTKISPRGVTWNSKPRWRLLKSICIYVSINMNDKYNCIYF